ncbi:hypothetical protein DFH09DRAFT_1169787 [Mycena vulgaris]|nr:hypothetical protein DFH09DRAFT_1169787 [Mycena vulgaris]
MNDEPRANPAFTSESTIVDSQSTLYTGAFFPSSQNLLVSGGVFTSNTHMHMAADLPSDFRKIPLGDIDLQREIRLDDTSGVVSRHSRGKSGRRMYSAKIYGTTSNVTVGMYEGKNAEEEWREHVSRYTSLRHPNLVQIFATASSRATYATVLHDDLVPWDHFLDVHRHSTTRTVYIWVFCCTEWQKASNYVRSARQMPMAPSAYDCTFWIRRSSGRMCADLIPDGRTRRPQSLNIPSSPHDLITLNHLIEDPIIMAALTLEQYHYVCFNNLSQYQSLSISPQETVTPGTGVSWSASRRLGRPVESVFRPSVEISLKIFPMPGLSIFGTLWFCSELIGGGEIMTDERTRYNASEAIGRRFKIIIHGPSLRPWLSQANHIFNCLKLTSGNEDCVPVLYVEFDIIVSANAQTPREGYLFLCPPEHFKTGPCSFHWPDCPAYWSLDPLGAERLSTVDAGKLGFPGVELETSLTGMTWDASVYAGLRQFHQAKGLDPDSQDVARHLGEPLYYLSEHLDVPLAQEANTHNEDQDSFKEEFEISNGDEPDESPYEDQAPFVEETSAFSVDDAEMAPLSGTWKFLNIMQLALIGFLASSWLYNCALGT